jgi:hypothetical protein
MCSKAGFAVIVFIISKMFLISFTEGPSSLSDVFHVAVRTGKLIDPAEVVLALVLWALQLLGKKFTDSIVGGVCDFNGG